MIERKRNQETEDVQEVCNEYDGETMDELEWIKKVGT